MHSDARSAIGPCAHLVRDRDRRAWVGRRRSWRATWRHHGQ